MPEPSAANMKRAYVLLDNEFGWGLGKKKPVAWVYRDAYEDSARKIAVALDAAEMRGRLKSRMEPPR